MWLNAHIIITLLTLVSSSYLHSVARTILTCAHVLCHVTCCLCFPAAFLLWMSLQQLCEISHLVYTISQYIRYTHPSAFAPSALVTFFYSPYLHNTMLGTVIGRSTNTSSTYCHTASLISATCQHHLFITLQQFPTLHCTFPCKIHYSMLNTSEYSLT
jgi:hypothetical protein